MKTLISAAGCLFLAELIQQTYAITKVSLVDHSDPNYMDRCLEITGELCDYCCMTDFEWCSRDIYNCQPTFNRNLIKMYQAGMILGGIIFGFPLSVFLIRMCMIERCCAKWFENTGGISCIEGVCRLTTYIFCCGRRFSDTYEMAQTTEDDDVKEDKKEGCCRKIFCCCCRKKGVQE